MNDNCIITMEHKPHTLLVRLPANRPKKSWGYQKPSTMSELVMQACSGRHS